MPTSPSRPRHTRILAAIVLLALLAVALVTLPASQAMRFVPHIIRAEDFSGTLWHGSAGKITVDAHDAGALEWHIHPTALLSFTLSADLHWVKAGFVLDGSADIDQHGIAARDIRGGGPIEDLSDLGLARGWRGISTFKFSQLEVVFTKAPSDGDGLALRALVGDLGVADLASAQIADGADLGSYALHIAGVDTPAALTDTGGPLEVNATLQYAAAERTGTLSGTLKERADAPPALRRQLENLSELHARDAQGRIPVDLEFTL